jgi:hypothetical protein
MIGTCWGLFPSCALAWLDGAKLAHKNAAAVAAIKVSLFTAHPFNGCRSRHEEDAVDRRIVATKFVDRLRKFFVTKFS